MRQGIIIEVEADERVADEVVKNIEATALGQFGAHELDRYEMHKEIMPKKISSGIQVPSFLVDRPFARYGRGDVHGI